MTDDPLEGIVVEKCDDQEKWTLNIGGPKDSPYEGGVFKVEVNL